MELLASQEKIRYPLVHRIRDTTNAASDLPSRVQILGENWLLFLSVPTAPTVLFGKLLKGTVPRDGVEPPTPAFSGLRSTT
jgi:hypothetical protein